MASINANMPSEGGEIGFSYEFTASCIGQTVSWDKSGDTDWFTVEESQGSNLIQVSALALSSGEKKITITPIVNNKKCTGKEIFISQSTVACVCEPDKYRFDIIIPQSGCSAGEVIGTVSGTCPTSVFTVSSDTIHCEASDSSDPNIKNFVLTEDILPNPSKKGTTHYISVLIGNDECTSAKIPQEGTEDKCDCDSISLSVTVLRTVFNSTGQERGLIGSGETICGLVSATTSSIIFSSDTSSDIETINEEDGKFYIYGKVNSWENPSEDFRTCWMTVNLYNEYGEPILKEGCEPSIRIDQLGGWCTACVDWCGQFVPNKSYGWGYETLKYEEYGYAPYHCYQDNPEKANFTTKLLVNEDILTNYTYIVGDNTYYEGPFDELPSLTKCANFSTNQRYNCYYMTYDTTKFCFLLGNGETVKTSTSFEEKHWHFIPPKYEHRTVFAFKGDFNGTAQIKIVSLRDCTIDEENGDVIRYFPCDEKITVDINLTSVQCSCDFLKKHIESNELTFGAYVDCTGSDELSSFPFEIHSYLCPLNECLQYDWYHDCVEMEYADIEIYCAGDNCTYFYEGTVEQPNVEIYDDGETNTITGRIYVKSLPEGAEETDLLIGVRVKPYGWEEYCDLGTINATLYKGSGPQPSDCTVCRDHASAYYFSTNDLPPRNEVNASYFVSKDRDCGTTTKFRSVTFNQQESTQGAPNNFDSLSFNDDTAIFNQEMFDGEGVYDAVVYVDEGESSSCERNVKIIQYGSGCDCPTEQQDVHFTKNPDIPQDVGINERVYLGEFGDLNYEGLPYGTSCLEHYVSNTNPEIVSLEYENKKVYAIIGTVTDNQEVQFRFLLRKYKDESYHECSNVRYEEINFNINPHI